MSENGKFLSTREALEKIARELEAIKELLYGIESCLYRIARALQRS